MARQASLCQQAFSKPCLVNLISKDTHLVFSIYPPLKAVFNYTFLSRGLLQKVVILHVKLKDNMQAFTHTFDPSDWAKGQNQLIQKAVMLHFKLKGIKSRKNATGVLKTRNDG